MSTLKAISLRKAFPGVVALHGVDFEVHSGSIHALVGANGAGKSTLIKILSGYYPQYEGQIEINGVPVAITRPADAFAHGIEVVHQEVDTTLIPYLTVAENLLIEKLASGAIGPFLHMRRLYEEIRRSTERVLLDLDMRKHVEDLSLPQKQLLVIARAVLRQVTFLILDEPTSSLGLRETGHLFDILKSLKQEGVGIIYVSHRLSEVKEIADEVTVLKDGSKAAHFVGDLHLEQVVEAMLGMQQEEAFPPRGKQEPGGVVLEARHITQHGRVYDASFQLRRGEILGITGLTGAGKTELLHLLFGAEKLDEGKIILEGRQVHFTMPGMAVRHGVYLVPEDRRHQGLHVENTVRENITLPFLQMFSVGGIVIRQREQAHARRVIKRVKLIPPELEMKVKHLSGGNQQKVVIGKWLGREPRVIMFDEATQGIDVGAKSEVYHLVRGLADKAAVIFASSDLDEILGLADRVLVMRDGRVVANFLVNETDRQTLLEYATGLRAPARNS